MPVISWRRSSDLLRTDISSGYTGLTKKERICVSCRKAGGHLRSVSYFDPDDLGVDCTYGLVQDFTTGCLFQFD
jgi:hypothetical protein